MGTKRITVATAILRHEADLVRLHLSSAGIPAFLADDGVVAANPLLANAVGWIKVQVDSEDEARARTLIASMGSAPAADDTCLSCGSSMGADDRACAGCGWTFEDSAAH